MNNLAGTHFFDGQMGKKMNLIMKLLGPNICAVLSPIEPDILTHFLRFNLSEISQEIDDATASKLTRPPMEYILMDPPQQSFMEMMAEDQMKLPGSIINTVGFI